MTNGRLERRARLTSFPPLGVHWTQRAADRVDVLQIVNGDRSVESQRATMSCSDAVNLVYEPDLPDDVALRQPADLTFSDPVHRLISRNRIHGTLRRPEPKAGDDSLLDEAMILFQDII